MTPTRTFFNAFGYDCVIIRGVLGERRERAGVIVAWDAKSMQLVPIGRKRHERVVVVKGRVMHMRFRVAGGAGTAATTALRRRRAESASKEAWREPEYDLDLIAAYMPPHESSAERGKETVAAWRRLTVYAARWAARGKLLVCGDFNAETTSMRRAMRRERSQSRGGDNALENMLNNVDGMVRLGEQVGTHYYKYGTDAQSVTMIDHVFAGPKAQARIERTATVDGLEVCSEGGSCHMGLRSVVRRDGYAPAEEAEWRYAAGKVCSGAHVASCLQMYRARLPSAYRQALQDTAAAAGEELAAIDAGRGTQGKVTLRDMGSREDGRGRRGDGGGADGDGGEVAGQSGAVRADIESVLGNPFPVEYGGSGDAACGAYGDMLRRLDRQVAGGAGGAKPSVAAEMAVEGWGGGAGGAARHGGGRDGARGRIRRGYETSESDVLRRAAMLELADELAGGADVTLEVAGAEHMCPAQALAAWLGRRARLLTAKGGGAVQWEAEQRAREEASGQPDAWTELERRAGGTPARIEALQRATALAMAVAVAGTGGDARARMPSSGGAGKEGAAGAKTGGAGDLEKQLARLRRRLEAMPATLRSDGATGAEGWDRYLPSGGQLWQGVPQVYQFLSADNTLVVAVRRWYAREVRLQMMGTAREATACTARADLTRPPPPIERCEWRQVSEEDAEGGGEDGARGGVGGERGGANGAAGSSDGAGQGAGGAAGGVDDEFLAGGELSERAYRLAWRRRLEELQAVDDALEQIERAKQDHVTRRLDEARERGHLDLERAIYQVVGEQTRAEAGERASSGVGLDVVRAGDAAGGEILSQPQQVLDAVRGFAEKMNDLRGFSVDVASRLLEAAGERLGVGGGGRGGTDATESGGGGEGGNEVGAFTEANFDASLARLRANTGLGSDGWRGVLMRWAPRWLRLRYLQALRDGAPRSSVGRGRLPGGAHDARVAATATDAAAEQDDYPSVWSEWYVIMIPKRGKDPSIFSKNRDIWLVPHGWKITAGMMRIEYEAAADDAMLPASSGFRAGRNAPEAIWTVRAISETAAMLCTGVARAFLDLQGFFMGIPRAFMMAMEHQLGVMHGATTVMRAVQSAATGCVQTAHGLTAAFGCKA